MENNNFKRILKHIRRSDIWFFGTVLLVCVLIPFVIIFSDLEIWNYFHFWWVILLPYVIIKIFYRKSKLFKWLNGKVLDNK